MQHKYNRIYMYKWRVKYILRSFSEHILESVQMASPSPFFSGQELIPLPPAGAPPPRLSQVKELEKSWHVSCRKLVNFGHLVGPIVGKRSFGIWGTTSISKPLRGLWRVQGRESAREYCTMTMPASKLQGSSAGRKNWALWEIQGLTPAIGYTRVKLVRRCEGRAC